MLDRPETSWHSPTMTDVERKQRKEKAMAAVHHVEAVLRRWDPIGVQPGEGGPADEYDSYAPHLVSMLSNGASVAELREHLGHIRTGTIGLPADPVRDAQCAEELVGWWIKRGE